jgi:hypothetical protein
MAALDSKIMDIKLANRKKVLTEYEDLYHVFYPNFSKKYMSTFNENPQVFKTCKGIFTNMYDAAYRNGNIIDVFKKKDSKSSGNTMETSLNKKDINNKTFGNLLTYQGELNNKGNTNNKNNSDNIAKIMNFEKNSSLNRKLSPKKKN